MQDIFPDKIKIAFIVIFFASCGILQATAKAQETGTLRGKIVDSTSAEILPFANVLIKELNTGASSNTSGYFFIPSIPAKKTYTLLVSYVGYLTKTLKVYISPNKITDIRIELVPTNIMLQQVEKIGKLTTQKNETNLGLQNLSMKSLEMIPQGVESDVFRSLQYIPGVQSTGDISARYYVRGSPSNENLVLLNGITIYNPFHAFGIFSVIDPDMINSVEFYKGGFPPEYGGRLSSVLNIITKDGNKNRYSASASSSFLSGKALVEGPIPHGSFIVTGRKSYSDQILGKFLNDQIPPLDFYDASFKLNYENPDFIHGSKFVVDGFFSGDNVVNSDPYLEDMKWANNLLGMRWFQITDSPLFYEIDLSLSNFHGNVNPKLSGGNPKTNDVTDVSFNTKFTYIYPSKDEIHTGIEIKDVGTSLNLTNSLGVTSDINSQGSNIDFYAYYKFLRYSNFGASAGTRIVLAGLSQSENGNLLFDPYANITYNPSPILSLKASWGIYDQQITTLSDENEIISIFEPWILSPDYLKPATNIAYSAGATIYFTDFISLDAEAYYKTLHNIPVLNDNKILPSDPDLVAASGESYGSEYQLKYTKDPLNITVSYTLSWAYQDLNGWVYYPRYDVRNSANIMIDYDFGSGWRASALWVFSSGLPFTQSLGFYNKFYFQDFYSDWQIYESYKPYEILSDKDLGRLPDYHRLDLSVSKYFEISPLKFQVDLSVMNVYNRKNVFYFQRNTGEIVYMLPFLPTATLKVEL
jgi:CarboxypepD_reg-like domain/TonB-dependent Receptor Plug Domain